MTALAASRLVKELATATTRRFPVAASAAIYEGAQVALSGAGGAAVAVPASANAALRIVGVAMADGNNLNGAAGAVNVDVKLGVFLMNHDAGDPLAIGDTGAPCYVTDDNTVAKTSASNSKPQAGVVWSIDASGGVWVRYA